MVCCLSRRLRPGAARQRAAWRLLGRETLAGLAANDNGDTTASTGRLEAELGYGIAMFSCGFRRAAAEYGLVPGALDSQNGSKP